MERLDLASKSTAGNLLGSRQTAMAIRDELEALMNANDSVEVDFRGTNPTQSFVDELIGILVLERGKSILSKLVFKNCSPDTKAILHLVVSDRLEHHERTRSEDEGWTH